MLLRTKSFSLELLTVNALIVFLLLGFIGFPGNFTPLLGARIAAYWSMLSEGLLLACGAGSSILLAKRYRTRYLPIGPFMALMLAVFSFCCSALLSSNPPEALYATARFFSLIMIGLYIGIAFPIKQILKLAIAAHSVLLVLYAFAYVTNPSIIFEGAQYFVGLYSSKNNCAYELGFALIASYGMLVTSESKRLRVFFGFFFTLNVFLIMQTDCLGVVLASATALIVAELCRKSQLKLNFGLVFVLINIGFALFVWGILPMLGGLLADMGKDTTLTGRTYVWSILLDLIQDSHSAFGYGYSMFWNHTPERSYWYLAEVRYGLGRYTGAHNLAIELCLNVGLFGMISFFVLVFAGLIGSKVMDHPAHAFGIAYVLYYTTKGLVERTSNISYDLLFLFVVIGLVIAASDAAGAIRRSSR